MTPRRGKYVICDARSWYVSSETVITARRVHVVLVADHEKAWHFMRQSAAEKIVKALGKFGHYYVAWLP